MTGREWAPQGPVAERRVRERSVGARAIAETPAQVQAVRLTLCPWEGASCRPSPRDGRGSPPVRRGVCIWGMSPRCWRSGAWPRCGSWLSTFASKTTTVSAVVPSISPRCGTTSPGWGFSPCAGGGGRCSRNTPPGSTQPSTGSVTRGWFMPAGAVAAICPRLPAVPRRATRERAGNAAGPSPPTARSACGWPRPSGSLTICGGGSSGSGQPGSAATWSFATGMVNTLTSSRWWSTIWRTGSTQSSAGPICSTRQAGNCNCGHCWGVLMPCGSLIIR